MKTLKLNKAWDHITPQVTTAYSAGEHSVSEQIYTAAEKAGVIEEDKADGGSAAKASAQGATGKAEK